jgi:phosphoenolpyruvate carboxylase
VQSVEIVLTAHPTQVMRRSLQHKQCSISLLLHELDRVAAVHGPKDDLMHSLFREVMATWQTDEIRRTKPTPVEEAKGGLHILEQSLWSAVPAYLRKLNSAVSQLCGQPLPIDCTPLRFASWMGGDRDGNPNVTAKARIPPQCKRHRQGALPPRPIFPSSCADARRSPADAHACSRQCVCGCRCGAASHSSVRSATGGAVYQRAYA